MSGWHVDHRGFTLVELMIASVLLAIGLIAVGRSMTALTRYSTQARARADLTELALGKLEELRLAGSVAAADSTPLKFGGSTTSCLAEHCDTVPDARGLLNVRRWVVNAGPVDVWTRAVTVRVAPLAASYQAGVVDRSTLIVLLR